MYEALKVCKAYNPSKECNHDLSLCNLLCNLHLRVGGSLHGHGPDHGLYHRELTYLAGWYALGQPAKKESVSYNSRWPIQPTHLKLTTMKQAVVEYEGLSNMSWLAELHICIPASPLLASISCQVAFEALILCH